MKIIEFFKQKDKQKHLIINFLVMLIIGLINAWLASGICLGMSVTKEYCDIHTTGWSWLDLLADLLGALLGMVLLMILL